MGHGRAVAAVLGLALAFPAVAWGDGAITIEGPPADDAYVYRDDPGDTANLNIVVGCISSTAAARNGPVLTLRTA